MSKSGQLYFMFTEKKLTKRLLYLKLKDLNKDLMKIFLSYRTVYILIVISNFYGLMINIHVYLRCMRDVIDKLKMAYSIEVLYCVLKMCKPARVYLYFMVIKLYFIYCYCYRIIVLRYIEEVMGY